MPRPEMPRPASPSLSGGKMITEKVKQPEKDVDTPESPRTPLARAVGNADEVFFPSTKVVVGDPVEADDDVQQAQKEGETHEVPKAGWLSFHTLLKPQRILQSPTAVFLSQEEENWGYHMNLHHASTERILKYLHWRRSKIQWAIFPFAAAALVFVAKSFIESVVEMEKTRNDDTLGDSYKRIMNVITTRNELIASTATIQLVVIIIGGMASLCVWHRYSLSMKLAIGSFVFAFFLPFIVFFLPWTQIAGMEELMPSLCENFMNIDVWPLLGFATDASCCRRGPAWIKNEFSGCMSIDESGFLAAVLAEFKSRFPDKGAMIETIIAQALSMLGTFLGMMLFSSPPVMYMSMVIMALKQVGPALLGLQSGMVLGSANVVNMIPESRVAVILLGISIFIGMPAYFIISCVPVALIGTVIAAFGGVSFALGNLTYLFNFALLYRTTEGTKKRQLMSKRAKAGAVLKALGGLLFFLAIFTASHLRGYAEELQIEQYIKWYPIVSFLVKYEAVSLLAQVATSDLVLFAVYAVENGHSRDDEQTKHRFRQTTDDIIMCLGNLKHEYTSSKAGHNEGNGDGAKAPQKDTDASFVAYDHEGTVGKAACPACCVN